MSFKVRLTPEAESDLAAAYAWYEDALRFLGDRFLDAVREAGELLAAQPEGHPLIHRDLRRALLRTFPYGLFYVVEGETVLIIGCFHVRRDPTIWKDRGRNYRA